MNNVQKKESMNYHIEIYCCIEGDSIETSFGNYVKER